MSILILFSFARFRPEIAPLFTLCSAFPVPNLQALSDYSEERNAVKVRQRAETVPCLLKIIQKFESINNSFVQNVRAELIAFRRFFVEKSIQEQ